jgi:hypothetical protein
MVPILDPSDQMGSPCPVCNVVTSYSPLAPRDLQPVSGVVTLAGQTRHQNRSPPKPKRLTQAPILLTATVRHCYSYTTRILGAEAKIAHYQTKVPHRRTNRAHFTKAKSPHQRPICLTLAPSRLTGQCVTRCSGVLLGLSVNVFKTFLKTLASSFCRSAKPPSSYHRVKGDKQLLTGSPMAIRLPIQQSRIGG